VESIGQLFHHFVDRNMEKTRRHSIITEDKVLQAVKMFRWVTRWILVLFFGGGQSRIKALEEMLPSLEREGRLIVTWHSGKKVYSIARKKKEKKVSIPHEIACALILVLLWRCRMSEGEIVPERVFRGFGIVPEGGLRYSEERNTMLIFEYCTLKNFMHGGVMKSKITRYIKYLPQMEARFGRRIKVLFVLDIERTEVKKFVKRIVKLFDEMNTLGYDGSWEREDGSVADGNQSAPYGGDRFPLDPFLFTDYETFKTVPVGESLKAKIYFWHDGNEWRLTNND
jgi:hypothetical protein